MSFREPLLLAGLVFVPLALLAYWAAQRRRRRFAVRYPAVDVLAGVAGKARGRHLPALLALLSLAALGIALGRPERTIAVEQRQGTVMLVHDTSGSMQATDVKPSRLVAARRAAREFVKDAPRGVNIGVMAFSGRPRVLQSPTTERTDIETALNRLAPSGGTATGEAIAAAVRTLRIPTRAGRRPPPSAIVLLSDGASTKGKDPVEAAREARRAKIPVYTIALGTPQGTIEVPRPGGASGTEVRRVPPDPRSLAEVARASGGQTFTADNAGELRRVYDRLGSQLGTEKRKRQLTSSFAGGALVLLLAGAGMSLAWFGRLV
jgi:Ca-activated chloride channel family protein